MIHVPGYYCAVVWTPQGWRVLAGGWPNTATLVVYTLTGDILSTTPLEGLGAPLYLKAESDQETGRIMWASQGAGDRLLWGTVEPDGTVTARLSETPVYGQCGVAVARLNGEWVIYALISATHYVEVRQGVAGPPMPVPMGKTSQGWIDAFGGVLRWRDLDRVDQARRMLYDTTQGAVTVGQDLGPIDRLVGEGPNGRFLVADELGQEPTIAMSPAGGWAICWRALHGLIGMTTCPPYPPIPPEALPPFQPTTHAIAVGIVDDTQGGPTWIGYDVKTGTWETPTAQTRAVMVDISKHLEQLAHGRRLAASIGVPVLAYVDGPSYNLPVPEGCRPLVQAYLQPGESCAAFNARIDTEISRLSLAGHQADLCLRAFTGQTLDGSPIIDPLAVRYAMREAWAVATFHGVGAIWCFADARADGLTAHLEFRTDIEAMRAASADWTHFPTPEPPDPPAESDDDMPPVMLPDGPALEAFRVQEGAAFDANYGPLLNATNGVGEASEVNSYLRTHHQMDGDRALLQPLMLENAMRKRTGTSDQMAGSIDAAVAAWRRLRGGK